MPYYHIPLPLVKSACFVLIGTNFRNKSQLNMNTTLRNDLSIFHYRGTMLKAWSLGNRMNSYTMIRVIRIA